MIHLYLKTTVCVLPQVKRRMTVEFSQSIKWVSTTKVKNEDLLPPPIRQFAKNESTLLDEKTGDWNKLLPGNFKALEVNYISSTMFYSMYTYLSNLPRWHLLTFAVVSYALYYLLQVVKRPILACSDGPFKKYLHRKLPTLEMKFWPTFWCVESRAQTVFASILRAKIIPSIDYRRDILVLKDGGEVALDWMEENCAKNSPCILILPGLTGASQAEYIKCLVIAANTAGMRVVVFNNRGLGGIELKTPRLYCASNCEDLSEVVHYVRKTIGPECKLGATGISMGGLILGNYLARKSAEARSLLTAAKIISVPWDVHKGTASIEKPILNSLLGRHLASSLCRTLTKCEIYKDTDVDLERIRLCKTIKEFDALFTSKQFGYSHVDEYYSDATLHNKLDYISVPLLCLSAADDPFQPLDAIPIKAAENSSHVAIVVTARGGHIGFLEGWWPSSKEQYMGRLFAEYFTKVLFDEDGEFARTAAMMEKQHQVKPFKEFRSSTMFSTISSATTSSSAPLVVEKFVEINSYKSQAS